MKCCSLIVPFPVFRTTVASPQVGYVGPPRTRGSPADIRVVSTDPDGQLLLLAASAALGVAPTLSAAEWAVSWAPVQEVARGIAAAVWEEDRESGPAAAAAGAVVVCHYGPPDGACSTEQTLPPHCSAIKQSFSLPPAAEGNATWRLSSRREHVRAQLLC